MEQIEYGYLPFRPSLTGLGQNIPRADAGQLQAELQKRLAMIPYRDVQKWKSWLVVSVAANIGLIWVVVDLLWKGGK